MSASSHSGKHRLPLISPVLDPTSIFELFRGSYGSELLTAAVAHFQIFSLLHGQRMTFGELRDRLGLVERPAIVLVTALRAMGLLIQDELGWFELSDLAREHLAPGAEFYVGDYVGLAANSPGVLEMVQRLTTNRPAHAEKSDTGAAFIYRDGLESAMEKESSARRLTLALAGRAKNVAPVLAEKLSWRGSVLLDVGGGTGIYSIAWLRRNPASRAIVFDRPEVLKIAAEFAIEYGVADRLECHPGDMFVDELPRGVNTILLSNILHDWNVPECRRLIQRCAAALVPGGELVIHDVFLNDELDGPLPVALYSAALFTLTEGRAYSAGEYRVWLREAGLFPSESVLPTLIHCGLLGAMKAR
ncbi:MAG: methylase involved in ubiquinone/menaquinone biosynthesis [Planctomycetaceae bacterium]|nr:methylase involved in ubiquinone/menaquinone biosynthesis [Planctomycetaceae bacterium]